MLLILFLSFKWFGRRKLWFEIIDVIIENETMRKPCEWCAFWPKPIKACERKREVNQSIDRPTERRKVKLCVAIKGRFEKSIVIITSELSVNCNLQGSSRAFLHRIANYYGWRVTNIKTQTIRHRLVRKLVVGHFSSVDCCCLMCALEQRFKWFWIEVQKIVI